MQPLNGGSNANCGPSIPRQCVTAGSSHVGSHSPAAESNAGVDEVARAGADAAGGVNEPEAMDSL